MSCKFGGGGGVTPHYSESGYETLISVPDRIRPKISDADPQHWPKGDQMNEKAGSVSNFNK